MTLKQGWAYNMTIVAKSFLESGAIAMNRINILIIVLLSMTTSVWSQSSRTDYRLDHELFRRGLIDRGFNDWLKIYDKEFPPKSDLDLLAEQIGTAWEKYRQETEPAKRSANLETLLEMEIERIESYPDYPLAANWRVRYAADLLNEKFAACAFVHLVGLELPAELRATFSVGLEQIEVQLEKAKLFLKTQLGKFQTMNNEELSQINQQGLPELYQSALYQADYLRAWCLYHRAHLLGTGSSQQVKILYQLSDLLESISTSAGTMGGSEKLLSAIVFRMLGKPDQAKALLADARRTLPASSVLFADIEEARVFLAQDQPGRAPAIVENCTSAKAYQNNADQWESVNLSLAMIAGRSRIAMLSAEDQTKSQNRNKALASLREITAKNTKFRAFVFPVLLEMSAKVSQQSLSDIELLAFAENARSTQKTPVAMGAYRRILSLSGTHPEFKITAALELAGLLEEQGQISQAVEILSGIGPVEGSQAADLMMESARLAWLAYCAKPDERHREIFIKTTTQLLDRFSGSPAADQFKLLMAQELSQSGKFDESRAWIEQVPAGSALYLQAKATEVLVLSRQYRHRDLAHPTTRMSGNDLAEQIQTLCHEMMTIASARQAQPDKIETWKLDDAQVKLLAGAILATANVLADPGLGRGQHAKELMEKYRPVLARYQQTSKSAIALEISTLVQTQTPAGQIEAMSLAMKMIDQNELPAEQQAAIVLGVLESIHRFILDTHADPMTRFGDLTQGAFLLSRTAINALGKNQNIPSSQLNRLREFEVIAAVDAGQYNDARSLAAKLTPDQRKSPDVQLAISQTLLVEKKYFESAGKSMELLSLFSPADIRYWQALIINLHSHLGLGSDPSQIASAIVARQEEYPELGNAATKSQLIKILDELHRNKN